MLKTRISITAKLTSIGSVVLKRLGHELMTLGVFWDGAGFKLDSKNIHMNVFKWEIITMMMMS